MIHSPIRIIYLIGELGLGGSERQLYLLLKHMDKTRYEPRVIVFNTSQHLVFDHAIASIGIPVMHIPPKLRTVPQRFFYLLRLFLRIRPHVVHSWTIHDNVYAGLVGWLAGVPLRWGSVRGSLHLIGFRSLPVLSRWLSLQLVSRLVVNAQSIANELLSVGVNTNRILRLQNCIDSEPALSPTPLSDFNIPPDSIVIGTVGNLRRVKNQEMLIRAIGQLISEFPTLHALIVGQTIPDEPGLHDQLHKMIRNLNLENKVILTGIRGDVPSLMRCFSVFCLTSDSEGTPNVLLEAMAAKCAIIATNVGGIPELIQAGVTGILVPPGNVSALTEALRALLQSPDIRQKLGQAAYDALQPYDCDRVAQSLCHAYDDVLSLAR